MHVSLLHCTDSVEAKEVMNDAFFKAFKSLDRFDSERDFKPWLRRIIVNTSLDRHRSKSRKAKVVELQANEYNESMSLSDQNLDYNDLLSLINKLSPRYKMVFTLYCIEGYSHKEIAEQLEITEGTSKSNLHRAKLQVQDFIKQYSDINYARQG